MAANLPPVPYKAPVLDQTGFLTSAWAGFFEQLFKRVGGNNAPSIDELASSTSLLSLKTSVTALQTSVSSLSASVATLQSNINDLNLEPV